MRAKFEFSQQNMQLLGKQGAQVLKNFLVNTKDIRALILKSSSNNYKKLLTLCLDLMIANSTLVFGDIRRGYLSYRSHVNGYFTLFLDPIKTKDIFNNEYLRLRHVILHRIQFIIEDLKHATPETLNTVHGCWYIFIQKFIEQVRPLIQRKQIFFAENFEVTNSETSKVHTDLPARFTTYSKFHANILQNTDFLKYMRTDLDFLTFRLITICLYTFMQKLGVKNYDKYLLCYLIAEAVEEKYNINPESLISGFYFNKAGTPSIKYEGTDG